MTLRSLLYVPADNQKFIAKAHLRGADAIILDLEDAVTAENKATARENLAQSVKSCGQSGAVVFIRINSDKATAKKDAKAAVIAGAAGLYVPKANVKRLRQLDSWLNTFEPQESHENMVLIALIEDAKNVLRAEKIARQKRIIALTIGAEDYANSIGANADPDVLLLPKQMVHMAAKSHNRLSFGLFHSVSGYTDTAAIKAAALKAKRFGFDGASCVHPDLLPILNEAFLPSESEQKWALSILEKHNECGKAAFLLAGQMIDKPLLERARKIISDHKLRRF